MAAAINLVRTADGDLAARVEHLVFALMPMRDGSLRTQSAYSPKDPSELKRSDFFASGLNAANENDFLADVEGYALHLQQQRALGRQTLSQSDLRMWTSPWGRPDHGSKYAIGIASVSTPGHGGFIVMHHQNELIDARWRTKADGYAGPIEDILDPEWRSRPADLQNVAFYEEDQQWAIVAVSFPELFTDYEKTCARRTLMDAYPDEWEAIFGEAVPIELSSVLRLRAFHATNKGRWIVTSAIHSKDEPGFTLVTAYRNGRDRRGRTHGTARHFLLPSAEYIQRQRDSGVGYAVIDEAGDRQVDAGGNPLSIAA